MHCVQHTNGVVQHTNGVFSVVLVKATRMEKSECPMVSPGISVGSVSGLPEGTL